MPLSQTDPGLKPCNQPNCDNPSTQRVSGWCGMHYMRIKKGSPEMDAPSRKYYIPRATGAGARCNESDCDRVAHTRGFCNRHYTEKRRSGTLPELDARICFLDGEPANRSGVCAKHYNTMRSFGWRGLAEIAKYKQDGCAICGNKDRTIAIDHDHSCCGPLYGSRKKGAGLEQKAKRRTCGKCLRSALCSQCNVGLGYFEESKDRLSQAIQYLEKWEAK